MEKESFKFLTAVEIFLLSPDEKEVLLIHRSKEKEYLPDYWAGVGGKMDSPGAETPIETAYREIKEEANIKKNEIENLQLKGVITVFDRFGKWIVFEFAGKVKNKPFSDKREINEGTLQWIPLNKLKSINLIQDLRNNVLEKILFTKKFLWMQSIFNNKDKLIDFKCQ